MYSPSVDRTAAARAADRAWALPALLIGSTLLHLILLLRFPLAPDETYYWEWSRHLGWGYYDQGPMVAWWIRATCLIFGDTPLGIRFGIVLAALGIQVLVYLMARDLFGRRAGLLAVLFSTITPLALAGSFVATYDPLLAFFWTAAMYCAMRALFFKDGRAWIGLGLALGLGLLSKHTMALFVPCLALYAVGVRTDARPPIRYALLTLGIGTLVFVPNLVWQANHEWLTLRHLLLLTNRGVDHRALRRLGDYVGSQVGLITPLLCFGFVAGLVWAARDRRKADGERLWLLFCMSAPVLLSFLVMTAKAKVQANWAVIGWVSPPILYAAWLERASVRASRYASAACACCGVIALALIVPEVRPLLHVNVPHKWDQMNRLYGGAEIADAAEPARRAIQRETGQLPTVGAATYDVASRLAFYLPGRPPARCFFLHTRLNSYLLWNDEAGPAPGGNTVVVDSYGPDDPHLPAFRAIFDRVEPAGGRVDVRRPGVFGQPVDSYYVYRCYGYHPDPAVEVPNGG